MNLFFGKISKKVNSKQFIEGFYETNNPKMFNGIDVGDLCYIIADNRIQLWRADKWLNNKRRLDFEIIHKNLGIKTKDLIALKFFQLDTQLVVLTVRQSPNAFYRINVIDNNINEEVFTNINTYKDNTNYREIIVHNDFDSIDNESIDINLYYENKELKIFIPFFFSSGFFNTFIDNRSNYLKGQTNKDKTLKKIKEIQKFPKKFSSSELSILNLYDAFGVKYEVKIENNETINEVYSSLNQILYGPPGTGKTYKTINKAVGIIISNFSKDEVISYKSNEGTEKSIKVSELYQITNNEDVSVEKREILTDVFKKYRDEGKIEFVTFHQSFSYEDFVEGIKPILVDIEGDEDIDDDYDQTEGIKYELKPGIFKRICSKAKGVSSTIRKNSEVNFDKVNFFKMSLGGKQKPHIHRWCIENQKLSIGWGGDHNFKDFLSVKNNWNSFSKKFKNELKELVEESAYNIQAMYTFLNMKRGDIVVATKGNKVIDAIGVVSSDDYYYQEEQDIHYKQFRDIQWLATDMNASPELFFRKNISQQTIYQFFDVDVKKDEFKRVFHGDKRDVGNYVLIIDEINRGNVASIFGELITLIEPDKRLGASNEITVSLPYSDSSDELFGVPSNLYIIGTMNTADRSIEALDTALRRRFSFEFMEPNSMLVPELDNLGINLREIYIEINRRITYLLDSDHQIGHSYFIGINNLEELKQTFKDKIIPLLKEYFFNDYGKIRLVLGDGFVSKIDKPKFAVKDEDEIDRELYEIISISEEFDIIEALKKSM